MNRRLVPLLLLFMSASHAQCGERFDPPGLFLTWQRDPASTMTIQWLEQGEPAPAVPDAGSGAESFSIGRVRNGPLSKVGDAVWSDGYAIDFLADTNHRKFGPSVFDGVARIGWNETGLIFGFEVRQKEAVESDDLRNLWSASSVEIIVGDGLEAEKRFHLAIAPGLDPRWPEPRHSLRSPETGLTLPEGAFQIEVGKIDGGYRLLAMIPWNCLPPFKPAEGKELRAQLYVNNREGGTARRLAWFPSGYSGVDTRFTHRIRLGSKASPPYRMAASIRVVDSRGVCSLYSLPGLAGASVSLAAGGRKLAAGLLSEDREHGIASVDLPVPLPGPGSRWGEMQVTVEGQQTLTVAPELAVGDYLAPPSAALEYWEKSSKGKVRKRVVKTSPVALQCWPGYFLHRVELTGLSPDTEYRFRTRGATGGFGFRTMPITLNRPVRIALGGDTLHRRQWLEKMNRVAIAREPDFILWGGDLADANGQGELIHRWKDWFEGIKETLVLNGGRMIPVVVAVGNHDVRKGYCQNHEGYEPTDEWRRRIAPEFYEFFAFPGSPGYGVLDFGDYLSVVVLDSAHTNPIAGTQTQWLESVLRRRSKVTHVLPVYHMPAYPSVKDFHGRHEGQVRANWTPLFDRYSIRSAFENHNHAYKRTRPIVAGKVQAGGTVYLGDGAWGVRPRPVHPVASTWYLEKAVSARYALLLTLEGDRQHYLALGADGETLDEFSLPPISGEPAATPNLQDMK